MKGVSNFDYNFVSHNQICAQKSTKFSSILRNEFIPAKSNYFVWILSEHIVLHNSED
jgi:hypothetical protein